MNKVLEQWIEQSDNIVFFGGAGVSTESGIPDFRSERGLYSEVPEKMISHTYYVNHTAEFYRFYKDKMLFPDAKPNLTHYKLAELEKSGKLKAVITQNIDGLHQAAGSVNVLELHGSVHRNFCLKCRKMYPLKYILNDTNPIPLCVCGGQLKPDVVLYEESLDMEVLRAAVRYISAADMLIVGGTSLVVQPAASLISYYNGNKLVLINLSETPYDSYANLVITEKIGAALG
ncbi:MAG: NAD-dependent protein deacylase [Oscillospiraceae bacterium]|nr:NAD-dependent protein deacylase [Oscillospiraceae bacterium]